MSSLFVSYSWASKAASGFGSAEITNTQEPRGISEVIAIAKKIESDKPHLESVIILNWKEFPA